MHCIKPSHHHDGAITLNSALDKHYRGGFSTQYCEDTHKPESSFQRAGDTHSV